MFDFRCIYFALLIFIMPGISYAQAFCFATSKGSSRVVRLQFNMPNEDESIARVKYENGNKEILAHRSSQKTISPRSQIPATVKIIFSEIIDKRITGEYILTITGTNPGELYYVRKRDGKRFVFHDVNGASLGDSCDWSLIDNNIDK